MVSLLSLKHMMLDKNSTLLIDDDDADGFWDDPLYSSPTACNNDKNKENFVYTTDCSLAAVSNSNYTSRTTVELGQSVTVSCDEGYWGGGTVTCGGKTFDKSVSCQLNTLYTENDFHCDVNDDGIEDAGEVIDFENSSVCSNC